VVERLAVNQAAGSIPAGTVYTSTTALFFDLS
jgi:hypothetical protein